MAKKPDGKNKGKGGKGGKPPNNPPKPAPAPKPIPVPSLPELQVRRTTLGTGHWRYFFSLVASSGRRIGGTLIFSPNRPTRLQGKWFSGAPEIQILDGEVRVVDVKIDDPKVEVDLIWKQYNRDFEMRLRGPRPPRPVVTDESPIGDHFESSWSQPGQSTARVFLFALVLAIVGISVGVGIFGPHIFWIAPLATFGTMLACGASLMFSGSKSSAKQVGRILSPVLGTNNRLLAVMFVAMLLAGGFAIATPRGPEAFAEILSERSERVASDRPSQIRENLYKHYKKPQVQEPAIKQETGRADSWLPWTTRIVSFAVLLVLFVFYIPFAISDEVQDIIERKAEKWLERGEGGDADTWFQKYLAKKAGVPKGAKPETNKKSGKDTAEESQLPTRSIGLPFQFMLEVLAEIVAELMFRRGGRR